MTNIQRIATHLCTSFQLYRVFFSLIWVFGQLYLGKPRYGALQEWSVNREMHMRETPNCNMNGTATGGLQAVERRKYVRAFTFISLPETQLNMSVLCLQLVTAAP